MRRLLPVVGLAVLLVALWPTAALGKAPMSASINGPGIDGGIDIDWGDPGSHDLAEHSGLFELGFADFGDDEAGLAEQQPDGDLGPEYRIEWTVPNSAGTDTFVQRLYPYAEAGSVTYTEAGQAFTLIPGRRIGRTIGGWHAGGADLRDALTRVGVPEQPPATGPNATPIAFGVVALCALGLPVLWIGRTVRQRHHAIA